MIATARANFGWIMAAMLMTLSFAARAQSDTAAKGFSAFRLLQTRNVFDPNRRAPRTEEPRSNSGPTRNRPHSFTLTGTMVTEAKNLAFFNGSKSDFNRVMPLGEDIAGFKLKSIAPAQVELEREGKVTTLVIGRTLQLEGTVAPDTEPAAELSQTPPESATSTSPSGAPPAPGGGAPPAVSGDKADVLRRMMERREKEMSK